MFNLTVRNSIRAKKSRQIVYKWFGLELITVTADDSSFTIRGQRGIRSLGGESPEATRLPYAERLIFISY